jgi:hypothetical protein
MTSILHRNAILFIVYCSFLFSNSLLAQDLVCYQNDSLEFESAYFDHSLSLDIHLPKAFKKTKNIHYPLIILFDSYNTFTHNHNLHTIDMLSFHAQMPQSVVVGIPFSENDRL